MDLQRHPIFEEFKVLASRIWRQAPKALFYFAMISASLLYGVAGGFYRWPPFGLLLDAKKTAISLIQQLAPQRNDEFGSISIMSVAPRVGDSASSGGPPRENFLVVSGQPGLTRKLCPPDGCLAVEYSRDGRVVTTYPFKPDEFMRHWIVDRPYETIFFDPRKNLAPTAAWPLPGGDVIVSLVFWNTYPFGGGIARVHPDGQVAWYRRDYSHHTAAVLDNGTILASTADYRKDPDLVRVRADDVRNLGCRGVLTEDVIEVLDWDGRQKERFSFLAAMQSSPFRNYLLSTVTPCDPLHVNLVRILGPELSSRVSGTHPNDLLVSMRNISAFAIADRQTHRVTHFYRGSFLFQHHVMPLTGSLVIMIDNLGADPDHPASRVLEYDLASGKERIVFPESDAPTVSDAFTPNGGYVDLSQDRRRALITLNKAGAAYEIDLADGHVLSKITNVPAMKKSAGQISDRSAAFFLRSVRYSTR